MIDRSVNPGAVPTQNRSSNPGAQPTQNRSVNILAAPGVYVVVYTEDY